MRATHTDNDAIVERVQDCIRRRGLDVSAWYLTDAIETLVWYRCRDLSVANRLRATRGAQLAALAGLVREDLTRAEYDALVAVVPANLHGIFMRSVTANGEPS